MSRDTARENSELRHRLRRAEDLLRVAALAVGDDPAKQWLARALLAGVGSGRMESAGEPAAPPITTGEPAARDTQQQE